MCIRDRAVTAVHKHGGGGGGGGVASAERQRLLELLGGVGDGMEDLAALASSHRMLKRSFSEEL